MYIQFIYRRFRSFLCHHLGDIYLLIFWKRQLLVSLSAFLFFVSVHILYLCLLLSYTSFEFSLFYFLKVKYHFDHNVSQRGSLWLYLIWALFNLYVYIHVFTKLGKFLFLSDKLSGSFSHSFYSFWTHIIHILVCKMDNHNSLRFCLHFSILFSFLLWELITSHHCLQVCWCFPLPVQICVLTPFMKFSI